MNSMPMADDNADLALDKQENAADLENQFTSDSLNDNFDQDNLAQ